MSKSAEKDWLNSSASANSLNGRSVVGIALQFFKGGIVLIAAMILSRLLDPSDFGVVAAIMPLIFLAQMLKDFGITVALIQKPRLGHLEVRSYFWIQVTLGFLLALLLGLSGWLWAGFYGDPRMIPLSWAMGGVLFLGVFGNVHHALLRRNLFYGKLTALEVVAALIGLVAAIGASFAGLGYWSLVVQQAVSALVTLVMLWKGCSWRPGKPVFDKESFGGLAFGGALTLGQFFDYLRKNVDIIVIRKFTDETQLGYYGRAHRIVLMPVIQVMQPVMSVALPLLSKRQEDSKYHDTFENIFRFSMAIAVPFGVVCLFFSESIVTVLLGEKWLEAIPIVRALGVVAVLHPIGNCLSINLIVFKRLKVMMLMPVVTSILSIIAYFYGIREGVTRLAECYAAVVALMIPVYCFFVVRSTPVCGKKLFLLSCPLVVCMSFSILAVKYFDRSFLSEDFMSHCLRIGLFFVVYFSLVIFVLGYRTRMVDLVKVVKNSNK